MRLTPNNAPSSTATATCSSPASSRRGNQGPHRRGARALRQREAGERAREDRRRGAHQFRRAHVQLSLRQARAPSAHGRADAGAVRRRRVHAPVQDQRQAGLRRRRLAMAPGLRHLEERRPDARGARHERGDLPRRGQRVQRPADVHPRQPQAGRARRAHDTSTTSYPLWTINHETITKLVEQRRHRRAQGSGRLDDPVPRLPGARLDLEPLAVEPRQRLPVAVRGLEPHPPLQAPRLHRAPRLHADPVPAGRLPAEALRRRAAVEGRHAGERARTSSTN